MTITPLARLSFPKCPDTKGPCVTGPLMHVLYCLQQTRLWSGETRKLRWLLHGWKNVEQKRTWSEGLCFSLFTELESILCLNVSHNSQIVLKCFAKAGLPGNPDVCWGAGEGPQAGNIISSLLPKQKENCSFSLFQQNTFKTTSWRKWKQTFPGEAFNREDIFNTSVGKWVSRSFWISSKLAVKANTIPLDGPLLFRVSLGTVRSFSRVLLDPANWSSVGNEEPTIIQGKPGIWKLPLRVFRILRHKRDQGEKNPHSLIFNYNRTHTGGAQKLVEWTWVCRSGISQQRRVYPSRSEGTHSYPRHRLPTAGWSNSKEPRTAQWKALKYSEWPIFSRVGWRMALLPIHVHLEPQNVTLFVNRVFADVTS